MYDRKPADGNAPNGTGQATLTVTVVVAEGTAPRWLRGTLEGDSDTANLDCGSAIVTAPDGIVTRANGGCELDDSVTVDQSGSFAPGTHTFEVTAGASVRANSTTRNVRAGAAYDLVLVVSACSVTGTPDADDTLDGTSGDDVICGRGGADDINGLGGNDIIFGGDGPDDINGGSGDDLILGGEDADNLRGGLGSDTILGGPDRDEISDLGGPNHLLGGDAGDDTICGSNERDRIEGGVGQ